MEDTLQRVAEGTSFGNSRCQLSAVSFLFWLKADGSSCIRVQPLCTALFGRTRRGLVDCSPFGAVSGRSHIETWAGCIVSLTTLVKSSLKASRSVSSLSLAEKASSVFLASYLLR